MPATVVKRSGSSLASFEVLVRKVKETFEFGNRKIRREIIQTYLQAGKYIHEHILHHKDRADYGAELIPKLSQRVDLSEKTLRRVLKLYREFPKIRSTLTELPLSQLYSLTSIEDETIREDFARRAVEGKWSARKLESKIKTEVRYDSKKGGNKSVERVKFNGKSPDYSPIVRPKLGTLYTYRVVRSAFTGELKIDQGFSVYERELTLHAKLKEGDIAESHKSKAGYYSAVKSKRTKDDLFTYQAFVERVIDADTLFVEIDLGFGNTTRQYLRLRVLDCPEIDTDKGRKAKEFVQAHLKHAPFIILTSTHSDKFDRYLADVFIPGKDFLNEWKKGTAVLSKSEDLLYLNNALLHHKLAVRVKE